MCASAAFDAPYASQPGHGVSTDSHEKLITHPPRRPMARPAADVRIPGARLRERAHDLAPDADAAAGDERHLPGERPSHDEDPRRAGGPVRVAAPLRFVVAFRAGASFWTAPSRATAPSRGKAPSRANDIA